MQINKKEILLKAILNKVQYLSLFNNKSFINKLLRKIIKLR